ncbi:unnamed protein product, partial [Rotaria magnacalcarata]
VKLQVENQQQKHHPLSSLVHSPRILTPSMNHQSSPETKMAKFIQIYRRLPRQLRLQRLLPQQQRPRQQQQQRRRQRQRRQL